MKKQSKYIVLIFYFLFISINYSFSNEDQSMNKYYQLGEENFKAGNYEKSLEYYSKTLELALKTLTPEHNAILTLYSKLGENYKNLKQYQKAIEFYQKALNIYLKTLGREHTYSGTLFFIIGELYKTSGKYSKAMEYLKMALVSFIKNFGEEHLHTASLYNSIGSVYDEMGQYIKAIEYLQKSLNIYIKNFGEEHLHTATLYNNIGLVYRNMTRYYKALEYLKKVLPIYIKSLGEQHDFVSTLYNNIGLVYINMAQYDNGINYYQKAMAISLKTLGEQHSNTATIYNNIGEVYKAKGQYAKAIEYYQKASAIYIKVLGEEHSNTANIFNNIGAIYNSMGQYSKGLDYLQKALAIQLRVFGENHSDTARSYNNIGNIYQDIDQYPKALEYFEKALKIQLQVLGEEHADTANTYNIIGAIYNEIGQFFKALENVKKSLAIRLKIFGKNHISIASSYKNNGEVYRNLLDYPKALEYHEKAINLYLKFLSKKHIDTAITYFYIGRIYYETNKYTEAIKNFKKAEMIYESIRSELTTSESRNDFRKQYIGLYDYIIRSLYYLKNYSQAYEYTEKGSSRAMLENLNQANIFKSFNFTAKSRVIANKLLGFQIEYNVITNKLSNEIQKNQPNSIIINNLKEELEKLQNNIIISEKKIFILEPKLKGLLNPKIINHKEALKLVNNNTAILEYYISPYKEAYLFILYKNKLKMISIGKADEINNLVNKFIPQLSLENENNRGIRIVERRTEDRSDTAELSKKLFDTLLKEGIKGIPEGANLLIVPSGVLAFLPFETLIMSNNRFLVNSYRISYTPSMSIYNTIRKEKLNNKYPLLAFGNAIYETNTQNRENIAYLRSANSSILQNYTSSALRSGSGVGDAMHSTLNIKNLPGTLDEVKAISKIYYNNDNNDHLFTGIDVCEERIFALNQNNKLSKYDIIHFATHGMVNRSVPELTSIILTIPDEDIRQKIKQKFNINTVSDGFFTVLKVLNLRLNSEIVTLSACQTGLGKIEQGEGLIGFTRAFLYAGTRKIVVSLWEVGDVSTMIFMSEFYKYYKKTGDAISSLNKVKQDFISGKKYTTKEGVISFQHPFFWAAFVLYGK